MNGGGVTGRYRRRLRPLDARAWIELVWPFEVSVTVQREPSARPGKSVIANRGGYARG